MLSVRCVNKNCINQCHKYIGLISNVSIQYSLAVNYKELYPEIYDKVYNKLKQKEAI